MISLGCLLQASPMPVLQACLITHVHARCSCNNPDEEECFMATVQSDCLTWLDHSTYTGHPMIDSPIHHSKPYASQYQLQHAAPPGLELFICLTAPQWWKATIACSICMNRESSFGHGTLDIINSTHLQWKWHRNQDSMAEVADDIFIVREPEACENQNTAAPPTASVSTQSLGS